MQPIARVLLFVAALHSGCAKEAPNELQELLRAKRFSELEHKLAEAQDQYQSGKIDDIELRLRYRALDGMSPQADALLEEWVRAAPKSYFALAARGYHHRSIAFVVRGNGLGKDVSSPQWSFVQSRMKLAEQDMIASLPLSSRPVMSHYVLLETAGMSCDRGLLARYFEQGTQAVPGSSLLYNRYFHFLKPRWCGSTEKQDALLARAERDGLPELAIRKMRAIRADDTGRALLEQDRKEEGERSLLQAAELGDQFGWAFRRESLYAVNEYACQLASLKRFCRS